MEGTFLPPPEVWFPAVALLVGTLLGAAIEALRERWAGKRSEATRREQRDDDARRRFDDFQRPNLIALQEEVARLARGAGQIHHHDVLTYKASGKWRVPGLPADIDEGFAQSQRATSMLRVRVADEKVRTLASEVSAAAIAMTMIAEPDDGDVPIVALSEALDRFNNQVGTVLRSIDRTK